MWNPLWCPLQSCVYGHPNKTEEPLCTFIVKGPVSFWAFKPLKQKFKKGKYFVKTINFSDA